MRIIRVIEKTSRSEIIINIAKIQALEPKEDFSVIHLEGMKILCSESISEILRKINN